MTAKEALREYVENLSEERCEILLDQLRLVPPGEPRPLTPAEIALIERSLRESEAGDVIEHSEVEREFGLIG